MVENTTDCLRLLAHPEVDVEVRDKWGRPPLHLAASRGLEEVCLALIARPDLDINAQAQWGLGTGFHAAAAAGLDDVCLLIVQQRPDFDPELRDYEHRTALMAAARMGMEAVCEALLDRDGAGPLAGKRTWEQDSTGRTALHLAVEARCAKVARRLLDDSRGLMVPGCTDDDE